MARQHKVGPTEPNNFSWVIEDEVCAMALPKKDSEVVFLLENNVRCLISLTNKRVPAMGKFPDIKLKKFRVQDFTAPSLKQIDKILKTIKKYNKMGRAVAIQCLHGTGRTGVVLACLLVKRYKYAPGVAISKVQTMRPNSFESQEQENRVHEFWERENNAGWYFEVEVDVYDESSDSSEDEIWFLEEEICDDVVEVYDDEDEVVVVHDDVVVYDDHDEVEVLCDDVDELIIEEEVHEIYAENSSSDSD